MVILPMPLVNLIGLIEFSHRREVSGRKIFGIREIGFQGSGKRIDEIVAVFLILADNLSNAKIKEDQFAICFSEKLYGLSRQAQRPPLLRILSFAGECLSHSSAFSSLANPFDDLVDPLGNMGGLFKQNRPASFA